MSFAIKHRDIEREWENQGGVLVVFLNNWRFLLTLRRSIPANILERMRRSNFISNIVIALEHLGANEQWSLWSTAHLEDCSLGLLHSFGFLYFCVIIRTKMIIIRHFIIMHDFRK